MGITTPKLASAIVAGESLAAAQFRCVKLDTNGAAVLASAGETAIGIVQNAPASAEFAEVAILGGGAFAVAQGNVTAGDALKVSTGGRVATSTANGDFVVARAMESATQDQQFAVIICQYTNHA